MTVAQTAAALEVTIRVVHLRIQAGLIPVTKKPGPTGAYLIDSAVVEYMAIQEAQDRARREARREARNARRATASTAA